jgi:two-component system phosphate regulon sensor histidine kinase PhoR
MEMFGSDVPLAGRSVLEVIRKHAVAEAIEGALSGRATLARVVSNRSDGERQIEIRAVPVTSSREIAAVALFIDVSEIERLQNIRKDFLDDFSHEVRTPLAALRTAADTLSGGPLPAEDEDVLRQIVLRQVNRIERLVRDISELNRIESGDLVLDTRETDLRHVLDELTHDFHERLKVSGENTRRITVRGDMVTAVADPIRLQQIFSNLLDNALKHGGGEIVVELARENGQAIVRVLDGGDGIPETEIDRIFNRFYRVDRSRSQGATGLGLGLAIARHLARLHGGTIRASNRPEGGAAFEVRLPGR